MQYGKAPVSTREGHAQIADYALDGSPPKQALTALISARSGFVRCGTVTPGSGAASRALIGVSGFASRRSWRR